MKRSELEKYLGKKVKIQIFDNTICSGVLHKTGEEMFKNNPSLYLSHNYYFVTDEHGRCISCSFRTSHVTKIHEEW